jgi:hypothetical protein
MEYKIAPIPHFKKEAKRLIKKYASLKFELEELFAKIAKEPALGISLGNNVFKIRIAISSKGGGKSGGGRIIAHVQVIQETVYLLSIYDKSEKITISDSEIEKLLKSINV